MINSSSKSTFQIQNTKQIPIPEMELNMNSNSGIELTPRLPKTTVRL